jgi:acyl carrier protein
MPKKLAALILELGIPFWNFYGPTEATVWATAYKIESSESNIQSVPIGRPLANVRTYILDSRLQPVPIGAPGELYIGGAGVSRGYLNRPELTTELFKPNPFDRGRSVRLYKTGDLAKYRPDGNIEFLGRSDDQIKLRGFRIELGEIESVLNQHPRVKESAVIIRNVMDSDSNDRIESTKSPQHLVAYVVPRNDSINFRELQTFLRQKVPDYMVPRFFVQLETLPLTPNGKVDRRRLPSPHDSRQHLSQQFSDPRTDTELLITEVWKEVLSLVWIGIDDSFFELGGHSLLMIRVISKLREIFQREISVRTLFEAPTIRTLAARIEKLTQYENDSEPPPIVPVPSRELYPLSYSQEHLWNLEQTIPGTSYLNVPFVYALFGSIDTNALALSLRELVRRHKILRTVFVNVGGRPAQVIKPTTDYDFEIMDLRSMKKHGLEEVIDVILQEKRNPLDLATGPLIRAKLLQLTDQESIFLVTLHHIVCDQWSIRILINDLEIIYQALSRGQLSPLPEVLVQFADFAIWERQAIHSNFMKAQLHYWTKQLSQPTSDNIAAKQISFRTTRRSVELGEELLTGIKGLAHRENCTPFMVLLAAVCTTIWSFTGTAEIRIGTLMANRRRNETPFTVGNFVNTVILRIKLHPTMNWTELLRQAREVVLAAHANQEYPFAQLIATLEEDRNIKRDSLFNAMLLYQTPSFPATQKAGLNFAPINLKHIGADDGSTLTACDLIFDLVESATHLVGSLIFKTERFSADEIDNMTKLFYRIVTLMILKPAHTISTITGRNNRAD